MNPRHALLIAILAGTWCLAGSAHASAGRVIGNPSIPGASATNATDTTSGFLHTSPTAGASTPAVASDTQAPVNHGGSKCNGGNDAALAGECIKQTGSGGGTDGASGASLGWQSLLPGSIQ